MKFPPFLSLLLLIVKFSIINSAEINSFDVENGGHYLYKCFEKLPTVNSIEIPQIIQIQFSQLKLLKFTQKFNKSSDSPFHFPLVERANNGKSFCLESGEFELNIPVTNVSSNIFYSFSPSGYLVYAKEGENVKPQEIYIHRDNYCISNITTKIIQVTACKSQCHIEEEEKGENVCIPKCCPIGQVMSQNRCVIQPGSDWKIPNFYSSLKSKNIQNIQPQFQYNYVNYHWNCSTETHLDSRLILEAKELKILPDGRMYQKHSTRNRWILLYNGKGSRQFCMDSYLTRNESSSDRLILLTCRLKIEEFLYLYPQLLFGITLVATLIHLMTSMTYMVLWSSQNVHGWTAFILSSTQVLLNLFLCILFGLFGFTNPEKVLTGQLFPLCVGIGILHHFLLISTFSWSSVFSFDAWSKIRSMTPVSQSKGKKRFLTYSAFGFGVPAFVVLIAILMEFLGDQEKVVKPGYSETCIIQRSLEYLFYVTFVILALFVTNMILALHTLKGVWEAKKGMKNFKDSKSSSVDNKSKLVIKLFVLMGVFLLFEIILAFASPIQISLWFSFLDFYRIFHAGAFFWIFVFNKKTITQLSTKFPKLLKILPSFSPPKHTVHSAVHTTNTKETTT